MYSSGLYINEEGLGRRSNKAGLGSELLFVHFYFMWRAIAPVQRSIYGLVFMCRGEGGTIKKGLNFQVRPSERFPGTTLGGTDPVRVDVLSTSSQPCRQNMTPPRHHNIIIHAVPGTLN